ncbi:MAG: metallophosphoesterase family protein [Candidatus Brocadia sp.]
MRKQIKAFLLVVITVALFTQNLYAQPLHFIAYGDTRRDIKTMERPQVKHNAIARVIRDLNPAFILFSGDMVYYNEFDKFREVIINNYEDKMIPLFPIIGNHELIFGEKIDSLIKDLAKKLGAVNKPEERVSSHTSHLNEIEILWEKLYKEIDSIPEAKIKKRSRQVLCEEICDKLEAPYISYLKELLCKTTNGQSWYSFNKEADGVKIKFIALNSSLPDDEEQFQWFLDELKQFRGPKIIFEHYPPYSIGHHGCTDMLNNKSRAARFRDRYTKVFNNGSHNIILVISGHDHNYQRFVRNDKTGAIQLPVYIVSGGGGAELTGQGECDISRIPSDGFQCLGLITAYQFVDVTVHADDKKNLILKCKVLGLQCDLTRGLPDDGNFERLFVKDHLEVIDDFTLNWQISVIP